MAGIGNGPTACSYQEVGRSENLLGNNSFYLDPTSDILKHCCHLLRILPSVELREMQVVKCLSLRLMKAEHRASSWLCLSGQTGYLFG